MGRGRVSTGAACMAEMHELCATKLRELGLRFVEIGGSWDERLERAVAAVDALLD